MKYTARRACTLCLKNESVCRVEIPIRDEGCLIYYLCEQCEGRMEEGWRGSVRRFVNRLYTWVLRIIG